MPLLELLGALRGYHHQVIPIAKLVLKLVYRVRDQGSGQE